MLPFMSECLTIQQLPAGQPPLQLLSSICLTPHESPSRASTVRRVVHYGRTRVLLSSKRFDKLPVVKSRPSATKESRKSTATFGSPRLTFVRLEDVGRPAVNQPLISFWRFFYGGTVVLHRPTTNPTLLEGGRVGNGDLQNDPYRGNPSRRESTILGLLRGEQI
ncbi:hypothetical protein Q1695_004024 [Nippostrongylus brasiliensis]|nr:hypothetical protein Q1695_004024 [Nippostrongylus brasiliensis]